MARSIVYKECNRHAVGARLLALRGKRTQEEVSKAIGISTSAISMYEQGERIPRDQIKVRLANFYQVSLEELFFEKEVYDL